MAGQIVCPVCGESNPADMEFCRNCQSRLHPLTGPLKGEDAPIQPGALPTKKVTSELEPLLPQWLRDARQQARDTAADDKARQDPQPPEPPADSGGDLLAGLASQGEDDEDDIPDWLAQITGATSKKKKPAADEKQVKWVELGHERETPPQEQQPAGPSETPPAVGSDKDELSSWFKQAADSSQTADFRMPPAPTDTGPSTPVAGPLDADSEPHPPAEDLGWLSALESTADTQPQKPVEPQQSSDTLDWLKGLDADAVTQSQKPAEPEPPVHTDVPDWLKQLDAQKTESDSEHQPQAGAAQPGVPDWLRQFDEQAAAQPPQQPPAAEPPAAEPAEPDWLKDIQSSPAFTPEESQPAASAEIPAEPPATTTPDWLKDMQASSAFTTEEPEKPAEEPATPAELPDWISALGPTSEPAQEQPAEPQQEEPTLPAAELPDWVSALRAESDLGAPAESPEQPAPETPQEEAPSAGAAFTPGALAGEDVDAAFASMQTPDWLSAVLPPAAPEEGTAPAGAQDETSIGPAELPSWVQAMRPVESAIPSGAEGEEPGPEVERRGPLAGLQGVLPPAPGAAEPSSKPKSHSIKLDASEQQLAHAALLEQILAAETSPIPMRSGAVLGTQKGLRWAIALLLLLVLGAALFGGTQIFTLPVGVPNETVGAIEAIEAVPADAPVLVVFDYQPSTVGEMEATGASLMDHLLLLKHPRLVLLSTSPTGPALAERFMQTTLADRGYARDQQYVDLGYLPGGLAGVYKFAQAPRLAMPLDAQSRPVWQSPLLAPVQNFSDFAAVIVMTDAVEAGRTWIEQTTLGRAGKPIVLVASAQAGPMLLPYVDSGQVNGMVTGLYGAVGAEQRNAGAPGHVRQYWDAYSAGLYLAIGLVVLGALANMLLGMRDRRAEAAE